MKVTREEAQVAYDAFWSADGGDTVGDFIVALKAAKAYRRKMRKEAEAAEAEQHPPQTAPEVKFGVGTWKMSGGGIAFVARERQHPKFPLEGARMVNSIDGSSSIRFAEWTYATWTKDGRMYSNCSTSEYDLVSPAKFED